MISIGEAAAFVVAKLDRLHFNKHPRTLAEFETAATQAARLIKGGLVDREDAANDLWYMANTSGLIYRHGEHKMQERMDEALDQVDHEVQTVRDRQAREHARENENAALDTKALEADAKNEAKLGLQITPISQIDIRAIEWLWPDRIALGKLLLVAGNGGIGKSTLLFEIAARVSRGEPWPDGTHSTVPQSVFLMSSEDDPADTIRPRLQAAGADIDKVYFVSMVREQGGAQRMFNLQADIERLEERIRQVGDVGLVVIDPVTGYLGKADSNSGTDVRRILTPLGEMAMRTRSAVLGITHFNKSAGGTANSRVLGSVAFTAVVRGNYVVTLDPQDRERRLFLPDKFNISNKKTGLAFRIVQTLVNDKHGQKTIQATQVQWESGDVAMTANQTLDALDKKDDGEAKSAKAEAIEFLREVLADGPKVTTEVMAQAEAQGLTEKPMRSARKELKVQAIRSPDMATAWLWQLPD